MMGSTTAGDVVGCLRAVAAFAAVLMAPGYCIGWGLDLLGFRGRSAAERAAWGVGLSFAVMPIAAVMLGKYVSLGVVCWVAGMCAVLCSGLMIWRGRGRLWRLGFGLGVVWVVFVVGELVDVGVGSRLYLSVTVFDHALRAAFVDAVMRTGVPPVNPLYWPGHAAPMRYYYFWYVLTAVAAKLSGATARQAMIASVVWGGVGLAAVVGLYCRYFLGAVELGSVHPTHRGGTVMGGAPERSWPRAPGLAGGRVWVGLALLGVTGLDILPVVAKWLAGMPTDGDMEWWSGEQVASWMDSVLWVPHHVAGLVCCLVGFLVIWMARGEGWRQRVVCGVFAGFAFASAFGLSTWVAVGFAMVMVMWAAWVVLFERASMGRVGVLVGAGVVAVGLLVPYLKELRGESSGRVTSAAGGADSAAGIHGLLGIGVRGIIPADVLREVPGFAALATWYPRLEEVAAGLVLLGPGYFAELGFFGVVLVVAWRARKRVNEAGRTALVLAVAGLMAATFVRSAVVANNDFGIRASLIAQFFLVLLGVMWWEGGLGETKVWVRRAMVGMMWIGLAGTVYQAVALRVYLPVEERLGRVEQAGLSQRAMALRRGFDAMEGRVPRGAVVQFDTAGHGEFVGMAEVMFAGRQMASALAICPASFGGAAEECGRVEAGVARLFAESEETGLTAAEARVECAGLGVDYLVVTKWDRMWGDRQGWVWSLPVVVDTSEVRVLDCRAKMR